MDHPTVQICSYHLSYPLLNNENQSALLNWSRKTYLKNKIFAIHTNTALVHRLESMEIRPPSLPPPISHSQMYTERSHCVSLKSDGLIRVIWVYRCLVCSSGQQVSWFLLCCCCCCVLILEDNGLGTIRFGRPDKPFAVIFFSVYN